MAKLVPSVGQVTNEHLKTKLVGPSACFEILTSCPCQGTGPRKTSFQGGRDHGEFSCEIWAGSNCFNLLWLVEVSVPLRAETGRLDWNIFLV